MKEVDNENRLLLEANGFIFDVLEGRWFHKDLHILISEQEEQFMVPAAFRDKVAGLLKKRIEELS